MDFSLEPGTEILRRTPGVLQALLTGPLRRVDRRRRGTRYLVALPGRRASHPVEECDWIDRTRVILDHGTGRVLEPVDREGGFARFAGWTLTDLLDRFGSARASNLEALAHLVEVGDLGRRGVHPTFGEVSLSQLLPPGLCTI